MQTVGQGHQPSAISQENKLCAHCREKKGMKKRNISCPKLYSYARMSDLRIRLEK
jgi:hypothetical protein